MKSNFLFKGLQIIKKRDLADLRQSMYQEYLKVHPLSRLIDQYCSKNKESALTSFLYFSYYLFSFLKLEKTGKGKTLTTFDYKNEKAAITRFFKMNDLPLEQTVLKSSILNLGSLLLVFKTGFKDLFRILRFIKLLKHRESFLITCRVLEFVAYTSFLNQRVDPKDLSTVISSSDVNPNGLALLLFAKKNGLKSIFFNHGLVVKPLPRPYYNLTILECKAIVEVYGEHESICLPVGSSIPKIKKIDSSKLKVGILLSTFPNSKEVISLGNKVKDLGHELTFIRPHPNELTISFSAIEDMKFNFPRTQVTNTIDLKKQIQSADLIIGGNSTALLDALLEEVPSLYFEELDNDPKDLFSYLKNNFLPMGGDFLHNRLADEVNSFYSNLDWNKKAEHYGLFKEKDYSQIKSKVKILIGS